MDKSEYVTSDTLTITGVLSINQGARIPDAKIYLNGAVVATTGSDGSYTYTTTVSSSFGRFTVSYDGSADYNSCSVSFTVVEACITFTGFDSSAGETGDLLYTEWDTNLAKYIFSDMFWENVDTGETYSLDEDAQVGY